MREKWQQRVALLLIFFAVGLLFSGSSAVYASDLKSLHILFTGGVAGRLEPSG